ncbi:hypothetical protein MIND_00875200 [Mycena indigotica]|uniref:Calcium permease n=1 Tax=Mycena indigotica TaxID=2126181 RepID=A0A8H6SI93_9AGAR|nr:uncharacterized protein MIND_00875200 [Mycena indigotica]KAF7299265.1 hypothetical protein MIND_00875200 [Mycena indigotica]
MSTPKDDGGNLSSTPTPSSHIHRNHSSQWSASETPSHHNQGTSYFNAQPSPRPTPILVRSSSAHSMRRGPRSTSVSSSHVTTRGFRDDALSEADEDNDNETPSDDEEHVIRRGNRSGKQAATDPPTQGDEESAVDDEDPITLRDRQSLINVEHPFGLPIWKPALYKKSRSVTRYADQALHAVPTAPGEHHIKFGNICWVLVFGWWLSGVCMVVSGLLRFIPQGGARYSTLVYGLGWYLFWPFGKYVEGEADEDDDEILAEDEESAIPRDASSATDEGTIRGVPLSEAPTIMPQHVQTVSWNPVVEERSSLLQRIPPPSRSYGATAISTSSSASSIGAAKIPTPSSDVLGRICFWLAFICIIAPLMLFVCLLCWAFVVTIPMAKLNWALIKYICGQPTTLRFCAAPPAVVISSPHPEAEASSEPLPPQFSVKHHRLAEGQASPGESATILLCIYDATGSQYYKYTVGGVNILFVNLVPVVFFVIFDGFFLLSIVEHREHTGQHIPWLLSLVAGRGLIFVLALLSVIPLSYFIGMAVASISAQSSIGMGAVINATFGSIIEIILYGLMLKEAKGHLVEGSIVGSLLAGVLLMPGMSMCSSALRRKEQKFNAKSAGVTSMMLIMAIIGTLTPTLFYQTYGNFQLICKGCPASPRTGDMPWICDSCYYKHPDPVNDPFYQSTVKSLMYFCAAILLFSYLIGLWFSLRTHASQIWQNPQQLLNPLELPIHNQRPFSLYHRLVQPTPGGTGRLQHKTSVRSERSQTPVPHPTLAIHQPSSSTTTIPSSPTIPRRVSYAPPGFSPVLESVDHAVKGVQGLQPLPDTMSTDDFTRAVAVATVSALRHQQMHGASPARARASGGEGGDGAAAHGGGHGGHEAPSWSRTTSASVLLVCTALYAAIAEILVDVVDVILEGSGLDEKFLGVTLFALVPNTTEFMNAMSFALNGNIALSMEIGSAYALQVCLLQIPAMVAFSAWYAPEKMGEVATTFTLIFPRWDVVAIILSMFLMTYTYIEAKSNYHRGSILILSYLVLTSGFFFAPSDDEVAVGGHASDFASSNVREFSALTVWQTVRWYISRLW